MSTFFALLGLSQFSPLPYNFTSPFQMFERMPDPTNRILIADDNQANCELLDAYLVEIDCAVEFAADGRATLDKVESFQPDLILLDVMMPKLSGFEVCKQIKANPQTRRIMVLMVTALNELGDIERAVEAGTNDFVSKPVNKIELLKRVENLLHLKDVHDENERMRRYIERMEDESAPGSHDGQGDDDKPSETVD